MFHVYHVFLFVHCSRVVTCWERADLLALLFVMYYCVFVTLPCAVLGQVWCLIVSIHDLCLLSNFKSVYTIEKSKSFSFATLLSSFNGTPAGQTLG